jgi:hypothetical protein
MCSQMQARWQKKCVESLPKIFGLDDERRRMLNSSGWELNFGTQLVHNNLRMRSVNATENGLRNSKQTKRDEYEQGRKISKPPPPDVGDRREPLHNFLLPCGTPRTMAD